MNKFRSLFASTGETGDGGGVAGDGKRDLCVHEKDKPVIIVSTFTVEQDLIGEIVDVVLKKFGKRNRIVFVTDCADFSVFVQRNAAFEYLPSSLEQGLHKSTMPWRVYLKDRWELLLAKWRPISVLAYGQNIDLFIGNAPEFELPE